MYCSRKIVEYSGMKVSVIIPTYNGVHLLKHSLSKLSESVKNIGETEIIIVDNASIDETKKYMQEKFPEVIYVRLTTNSGFTGAVNRATKQAKGDYILILNNDCYLQTETLSEMFICLKKYPEYIATQPIVYKSEGRRDPLTPLRARKGEGRSTLQVENIGYVVDTWVGKAHVVTDKSQISTFNFQTNSEFQNLNSRFIYGLSATCLLIQRDIFVEIGMFDESFHSYLEDIDLFIRLNKKGYQYAPTLTAICEHEHMVTSIRMGRYKQQQDLKNWIRIILKNYSKSFIFTHFSSLFTERLRNLFGLLKTYLK